MHQNNLEGQGTPEVATNVMTKMVKKHPSKWLPLQGPSSYLNKAGFRISLCYQSCNSHSNHCLSSQIRQETACFACSSHTWTVQSVEKKQSHSQQCPESWFVSAGSTNAPCSQKPQQRQQMSVADHALQQHLQIPGCCYIKDALGFLSSPSVIPLNQSTGSKGKKERHCSFLSSFLPFFPGRRGG